MAIDFYELGKQSGATTPKGQQSGFQSLVSSATKPIEDMLANSKAATAALTAAMPAGVPIEKVPEELRGQVTNFLTENKKSYTDATKVIASGINPQSDRYKNAVETINKVNTRFENLSGNLENIALERQKYLDDPSYSPNTSRSNATIMSDLANGSLYGRMTINEDGSWNYKDSDGESKAFKDFRIDKQGYLGQQGHLAMVEHLDKNAYNINGNVKNWEGNLKNYYNLQINNLFNKLGPKGSQDYVMADDEFLQARYDSKKLKGTKGNFEDYKDALTQSSKEDLIEDYKQYNLSLLEKQHGNAVAKKQQNDKIDEEMNYFSDNQVYSGGIPGSRINTDIKKLESGEITIGGVTYNSNPKNNSWTPRGKGEAISGNDMLSLLFEKSAGEFDNNIYYYINDTKFTRFKGTAKEEKETLITTKDKTAYTKKIKDYFTEELSMFDKQGNFIQSKNNTPGFSDDRFGKRKNGLRGREAFTNLINKILKDYNIENKEASFNTFSNMNGISLNGKNYTFEDGDFDYYTFMKDLDEIIMGDGGTEANPPQKTGD
jgi:hypothetical protein